MRRLFVLPGAHPGLRTPGNIDLLHRPNILNPDGTYSSVRSISGDVPGVGEVMVPTALFKTTPYGKDSVTSDRGAWTQYFRTGQQLGVFDTPVHANAYADALHRQQAAMGNRRRMPTEDDLARLLVRAR